MHVAIMMYMLTIPSSFISTLGGAGLHIADASGIFPTALDRALRPPSPRKHNSAPMQHMDSAVKMPAPISANKSGLYLDLDGTSAHLNPAAGTYVYLYMCMFVY